MMSDQTVPGGSPVAANRPGSGAMAPSRPWRNISRILLVLPALNEAGKIGRTIAKVPAGVVDEILLVDDGSTDGTGEEAAARAATGRPPSPEHGGRGGHPDRYLLR